MSNYGVPEPSDEQKKLLESALEAIDHAQRPWWHRMWDHPCYVVLALGQMVRRRWSEFRQGAKP